LGNDGSELDRRVVEAMGEISSELAHDLRGPLQTIRNAVFLLERSPGDQRFLEIIHQSVDQATRLLDAFRDFYKGHILNPMEVRLSSVVDLAFSGVEVPEGVEVVKEVEEGCSLVVDPGKLALAIRHLVVNGLESMGGGGVLYLRGGARGGGRVVVEVEDTGGGVAEEVLDVLFVPFHSEKKRGLGLGLPTAKRIVEAHGGAIQYKPRPGGGAVFTLEIPTKPGFGE